MSVKALPAKALRRQTDPNQFSFKTTKDLPDLEQAIGQERAIEAVKFATGIQRPNYNLFALGPTGVGKHYVINQFLKKAAAERETPYDWCYVYDFDDEHQPKPLRLPSGLGHQLRKDLDNLMQDIVESITDAFDSDDYRTQRRVFKEVLKERQEKAIGSIQEDAEAHGVAIMSTPTGFTIVPMDEGEPMDEEDFDKLPEEQQAVIEATMVSFQTVLEEALSQAPQWEQEQREKIRELDRSVSTRVSRPRFVRVREKYKELEEVQEWLNQAFENIIDNAGDIVRFHSASDQPKAPQMPSGDEGPNFGRRYKVNVLVSHRKNQGAPVIHEDWPTVYNLVGRIEYQTHMGAMDTDFTLIRPGALHKANGGYLILDIEQVLEQPHAWEQLKRALRSQLVRTGSIEQLLDHATTISLDPQPIPLDIKVVLIGEREIFHALAEEDPEFSQIFRVAADFNDKMDRTPAREEEFAHLIATLTRHHETLPLNRKAVARVIDHASRVADDQSLLSILIRKTSDLLREADYVATRSGHKVISDQHVQDALDARSRRHGRAEELTRRQMQRGAVHIDTDGAVVGQINGLAVFQIGDIAFGRPGRITVNWRLGKGEITDIEREVDLGGPLHSKGVLILTSYLGWRYAQTCPLSLHASIAMEQNYSYLDGDSASMAELCALLSAVSDTPIQQGIAITGAVDQRGRIQTIGGVNEKIEGFYDICKMRGLTGSQGVIIPQSNTHHLMLRQDIVEAAEAGQFHIYAVENVDEAMEVLTGTLAGTLQDDGTYPEGSLHRKMIDRVAHLNKLDKDDE